MLRSLALGSHRAVYLSLAAFALGWWNITSRAVAPSPLSAWYIRSLWMGGTE